MEDPQLRFYLRELDWEQFAEASGHGHVSFHPEDGPLWPATGTISSEAPAAVSEMRVTVTGKVHRILHLSDLHFSSEDQATVAYAQLSSDLRQQGHETLNALIVSGDLVNRALPSEYEAARRFLERVMSGFSLAPSSLVIVPGNHDVSWEASKSAYTLRRRSETSGQLVPGRYIEHSSEVIEVRDEDAYRRRFEPFAEFLRALNGSDYPLAYEDQGVAVDLGSAGLCVVGLNSAWEMDHLFRDRASINTESLARVLLRLGPADQDPRVRVAVFHHPLEGGEDSRIRDPSFLQQLAVSGFTLVLHGHVHKSESALFRYDRSVGGRQVEIIGAGTFGAPVREWRPGYPLQYNMLLLGDSQLVVETRCRRELNGAWEPDARWLQGPGKDPLPRYSIDLKKLATQAGPAGA